MANGKLWTSEEIETIRKMAEDGETKMKVAAKFGRTLKSVSNIAYQSGISFNRSNGWQESEVKKLTEMYESGIFLSVIAKNLGRTEKAITMKIIRLGLTKKKSNRRDRKIKFDKETEKELVAMYNDNHDLRFIGKEFGISAATVKRIIKDKGLKTRSEMGVQAARSHKRLLPFGKLVHLYVDKCLSEERIAEILKCTRKSVRTSLVHYGIETKPTYKRIREKGMK